jgi:hypothetical protein
VTDESEPGFVPPAERVAVFDNDGTLWCERRSCWAAFADWTVEAYGAEAEAYLHEAKHPTLGLRFASHPSRPSLSLLVKHDDGDREFVDERSADKALAQAALLGWGSVSMRDDWSRVFDG